MQRERRRFQIERNGASEKTKTPAPNYTLDNAVVVIDGMTNQEVDGISEGMLCQNSLKRGLFRNLLGVGIAFDRDLKHRRDCRLHYLAHRIAWQRVQNQKP